jgi:formate hydrogenlyase transcriptional activator
LELLLENASPSAPVPTPGSAEAGDEILSMSQLQDIERANFVLALEACSWKISGEAGAAALLGLKPSTLSSRLQSLGIERPR